MTKELNRAGRAPIKIILVIVIAIIAVIALLVWAYWSSSVQPRKVPAGQWYTCQTDQDCMLVREVCGGIGSINARYSAEWQRHIDSLAPLVECDAPTDTLSDYSAQCESKRCTAKPNDTNDTNTITWQTYRNEQYGFEVKYPPSLMPSGWSGQTVLIKKEASDAERLGYSDRLVEIRVDKASYRFEKYSNTIDGSIVEGFGDLKVRSYTINSYKAVEYGYDEAIKEKEIEEQRKAFESGASVGIIYFPKGLIINKDGAIIEISTGSYYGDFRDTFDQILSTFKFITDLGTPLMRIVWSGGLCPSGDGGGQMCISEFVLKNDGSYISGQNTGTLSNEEVSRLRLLMNSADFVSIKSKKLIGTCARSYDGSSPTYAFYIEGREEVVDSCDVAIDLTSPLFAYIDQLVKSIQQ